ncbi:MAG TPA: hypothetical protein VKB71_17435, partial [Rhizomicrobium sp.]|nr:hypothetical protein [Rhizomicrobium sp.]
NSLSTEFAVCEPVFAERESKATRSACDWIACHDSIGAIREQPSRKIRGPRVNEREVADASRSCPSLGGKGNAKGPGGSARASR